MGIIQENPQKNINYQYDLSCYNDATRTQNNSQAESAFLAGHIAKVDI